MRIKLTLNHWNNQVLPFNYQYLISSWVYGTLEKADPHFADWLHHSGYKKDGKNFKLFTFGHIQPKRYVVNRANQTLILSEGPSEIQLSFFVDAAMQTFITGLFKDQLFSLRSGKFKVDFQVSGVEMMPRINFQHTMKFRCISPICISQRVESKQHAQYMSPEEEGYEIAFVNNLISKYKALPIPAGMESESTFQSDALSFRLCSRPFSKLIQVKGIQTRGFLFDFELSGDRELMELGYYGGFGEKGSGAGFGMVKNINY